MTNVAQSASQWVRFGIVARAHGVRGEVRIVPDDPDIAFPENAKSVRLQTPGAEAGVYTVVGVRPIHGALLVTLDGISQREEAQALRGARLDVRADLLPTLTDGEFYFYELDGLRVIDHGSGANVGTVERVVSNGAQPLLILKADGGEQRLLPCVQEWVVALDREARTLTVAVPDGLWE